MPKFLFSLNLVGCGKDPDEAWNDAVEAFMLDPGYAEEYQRVE